MVSDGECQEGTTWESLLIGAKQCLDNLVLIVDYNKIQALSTLNEALPLDDLPSKFKAFNWDCSEVIDGHSFDELIFVLQKQNNSVKPKVIIVHTTKGKGIKAFENDLADVYQHIHDYKVRFNSINKIETQIFTDKFIQ